MPYTQGIKTIGLPSSDYLTCDAAIADYTGGIVGLSGDLTWIIEANTTWTANFNLYDHNGFTFKIICADGLHHYGDISAGVWIVLDFDVHIYITVATTGTTIIENVKIDSSLGGSNLYLDNKSSVGSDCAANVVLRNCIVKDTSIWMNQQEMTAVRYLAFNNKLINSIFYYSYIYGTTPHVCVTSIFENNSLGYEGAAGSSRIIMSGGGGGISKANLIVRNNVIRMAAGGFGSEGFKLVNQGLKKPIAYNNASSNTTAITPIGGTWESSSDNVGGILDGEFESLVEASADFMKLVKIDAIVSISGIPRTGIAALDVKYNSSLEYSAAGKILPSGGIPSTLATNDISGKQYGEFGMYPIGCYNAQPKVFGEVWEL